MSKGSSPRQSRKSKRTIGIFCEGKGDARFIKTFLLPSFQRERCCKVTVRSVGNNAILKHIPKIEEKKQREGGGEFTDYFIFADGDRWKEKQYQEAEKKGILREYCIAFPPCIEAFILECDKKFSSGYFTKKPCDAHTAPAQEVKKAFKKAYKLDLIDIALTEELTLAHFSEEALRKCLTLARWWKFRDKIIEEIKTRNS